MVRLRTTEYRGKVTSSMASRRVANFLPYNLPTFNRPHRLSVGALSQQSPLRLIELSILKSRRSLR